MPNSTQAFLTCNSKFVGAYVAASSLWVEIKPDFSSTQTWPVRNMPSSRITGLVSLTNGEVYASIAVRQRGESVIPAIGSLYQLQRRGDLVFWRSVIPPTNPQVSQFHYRKLRILGVDGDNFVYVKRPVESSNDTPTLFWSR